MVDNDIMMVDLKEQQDELLVLASIFDEKVFQESRDGDQCGGQLLIHHTLSHDFSVKIDIGGNVTEHAIHYLPPLVLNFVFPKDYPSRSAPTFTLSCKWLKIEQIERVCEKLDELWEKFNGQAVIFLWSSFLHDDIFDYLRIEVPYDINNVIPIDKVRQYQRTNSLDASLAKRAIQDISSQDLLLPCLLDYNVKHEFEVFQSTVLLCKVCFFEKFGKQCIRFPKCHHVYCKECMKCFFEVKINEGSVKSLYCPNEKCENQALPSQVRELVGEELFARYDRLLLQCSLDGMADIVYCPRLFCGAPVIVEKEKELGACGECSFVFCLSCKLTFHGRNPCRLSKEELENLCEIYENGKSEERKLMEEKYGAKLFRSFAEESMCMQWIHDNSKCCPVCNFAIEKNDGCNKMTCSNCNCGFCWLCLKPLSKFNPYNHYNAPGSQCHYKLFEGM